MKSINQLTRLILLIYSISASSLLANPVKLSNDTGKYPLGKSIDILIDHTSKLTFENIQSPKNAKDFKASTDMVPSFGYTKDVIWSRFEIDARQAKKNWYLEMAAPPIYDFRVYHRPKGRKDWTVIKVGSQLPFAKRPIQYRSFVFPIELTSEHEFYTRMQTGGSAYLPLTLWNPVEFTQKVQREQLFFGIFFGILLAMTLYNLFLWLATREINYLYYVFYISSFGMAMFTDKGLTLEYFWPNHPLFNTVIELFFYNFSVVWALTFSRRFLQTKKNNPIFNYILLGLTAIALVVLPLYLIGNTIIAIQINVFVSLTSSTMVLFTAAFSYFRGYKPARLFLLAFAGMILGIPITALKLLGVLESNIITDNIILITSVFEMLLLSFALADQISLLRIDREKSEKTAFETQVLYTKALVESEIVKYEKLKKTIQPHYLLNSLNAMVALIHSAPQKAETMVLELSEEFQRVHVLSQEKKISIKDEILLCKNHLRIMGLRRKKEYELITTGIIEDEKIPPLVFHTMIENALIHQELLEKKAVQIHREDFPEEKKVEYRITTLGEIKQSPQMRLALGVGSRYIKARLDEAWPSQWTLTDGPIEGGWQAKISVENLQTLP